MDIIGSLKDNFKVFLPVLGLLAVIVVFYLVDLGSYGFTNITPTTRERSVDYKANVRTNFGDLKINLYEDLASENVGNFVSLSREGFYDGLKFHRIIENFIIQTGDPDGDGYGGAGYYVDDEIVESLVFDEYTVAMANEGRANTNSSQFFITLKGGNFDHLDGNYTIIGEVVEGFTVVEKIGAVKVDANHFPNVDVVIEGIEILEERK